VTEYEVDPQRCEMDVISLVNEMLQVRLVEVQSAEGAL